VAVDVDEDGAAVEAGVARVELREGAGEVVAEDLVAEGGAAVGRLHRPGLRIDAADGKLPALALRAGRAERDGARLLYVLGEVEDGVAARRPARHLELQRRAAAHARHVNAHLEQVRLRLRHRERVADA
jgi:hypothetical protein